MLLRIRLKEGVDADELSYPLLTENANETVTPDTALNVQYLLRSASSVIYLKDENGEWHPYYGSDSHLTTTTKYHDDVIAIPQGYVGEVYIPMDSFFASLGSWSSKLISWDAAVNEAGLGKKMDYIAIVQTYADNTNASSHSVTYSDFQIIYQDIAFTESTVSLDKNLALKLNLQKVDNPTVESITYTVGDSIEPKEPTIRTTPNGYELICDGILPEEAGKIFRFTVRAKQGDVTFTAEYSTSIKQYCVELLGGSVSTEAKNIAADLLRYANAYQAYKEGEAPTDPIIDTYTAELIAAYGNNAAAPAGGISRLTESTAEGYAILGETLSFDNSLAIKVNVGMPSGGSAKIGYSIGEDEEIKADVKDGVAIFPIGAGELNKPITVKLYVGGSAEASQTQTYYVSDYFAAALADTSADSYELIRALYNYCYSTDAYKATLQ